MSARSQRGINETSPTKRFASPRVSAKNRGPKQQITYDYDAAISQPDVPNFLELKRNGRNPMVSGVPLRKGTLRNRIRSRVMSKKNFQKRSQAFGAKSRAKTNAKSRSPDSKNTNDIVTSSGASDEEKNDGEKENVTSNGTADVENSSNVLKKNITVDGQNVSFKEPSKEIVESSNKTQSMDTKVKNEKSNDCEGSAAKSPVQIGGSRIPRAKIAAFPIHTVHEFHPTQKMAVSNKTKDSTQLRCSTTTCTPDKIQMPEQEVAKKSTDKVPERSACKQEFQNDSKIAWNEERTSEAEADEEIEGDDCLTLTDESPTTIGGVDDPRVLKILQGLKLNCPCKSCTDHDLPSSQRQEDDSDLKSSSPEESRKKKWLRPLKYRKYLGTSSEDVDPSDANSENDKRKKRSRFKVKSPFIQRANTSSIMNATPKISNRQRTSFSFLNTLFDIVFWPYVFLKTNR